MKLPVLVLVASIFSLTVAAEISLPRSSPEAEGISSEGLRTLVEEAEQKIDSLHSLMIVRHGKVVAEGWWTPYSPQQRHQMFSLSKGFSSTAIGIAAAEGKLSIDDLVTKYFPDDLPANPSDQLKHLRIRDLLTMSTGQHGDDIDKVNYFAEEGIAKQFLALPIPHKPGTLFYYNTPASYMLSAIISKATGQNLVEFLKPRLFDPLGIEDPVWDTDRKGIPLGGFGLNARTEDVAKFGLLYLQRGEWQGTRLLPAEWVDLATSRQVSNGSNPESDWDQGYGFQFWRCRYGFYRGDGAFGQFCIVMPQYDTVIAITSGTRDMGGVMNLLWAKLLPELRPAALPKNPEAEAALKQKLKSLVLPQVVGDADSATASAVFGKRFAFPANDFNLDAITLVQGTAGLTMTVETSGKRYDMPLGKGKWQMGAKYPLSPNRLGQPTDSPVATNAAWTSPETLTAKIAFYETPFTQTAKLRFQEGKLHLTLEPNVGFGNTQPTELIGEVK